MKLNQIKNWRIKSYEIESVVDHELAVTMTCEKGDVFFCGLLYLDGSDSPYTGCLIDEPDFNRFTDHLFVSQFLSVDKSDDVYTFNMQTDDDLAWSFKVKVSEGGGVDCEVF